MYILLHLLIFLHLALAMISPTMAEEVHTDFSTYPNPQRFDNGYSACRLRERGLLCDPDAVLKDGERERINKVLSNFPDRTKNLLVPAGCKRQGVVLGLALSHRHIADKEAIWREEKVVRKNPPEPPQNQEQNENEFGSQQEPPAVEELVPAWLEDGHRHIAGMKIAEKLADKWLLDEDCHKIVMILLPSMETEENITIFSYKTVPLLDEEKAHLLALEAGLFKAGKIYEGLVALLDGLQQTIVHRQEMLYTFEEEGKETRMQHSWFCLFICCFSSFAITSAIISVLNKCTSSSPVGRSRGGSLDGISIPMRSSYMMHQQQNHCDGTATPTSTAAGFDREEEKGEQKQLPV